MHRDLRSEKERLNEFKMINIKNNDMEKEKNLKPSESLHIEWRLELKYLFNVFNVFAL